MKTPKQTVIQIQDEYIARINEAKAKVGKRSSGHRLYLSCSAAKKTLVRKLEAWGLSAELIEQSYKDAVDVADLDRRYGQD
jgi:hypothetical protein